MNHVANLLLLTRSWAVAEKPRDVSCYCISR